MYIKYDEFEQLETSSVYIDGIVICVSDNFPNHSVQDQLYEIVRNVALEHEADVWCGPMEKDNLIDRLYEIKRIKNAKQRARL